MHVVWAHDHTFYFNESGKFYSGGKLPYKVWERYLNVFDRLTVACRGKRTPSDADMSGKTLSSGPNVDFVVLPSLSNPVNKLTKRGYVEQTLTDTIRAADAVIARMPSEIGAEAIRIAKRLGKPYAVEMVACAWDGLWNYGSLQGKLYAPLALWKNRRLVKHAPFAVYVTERFLQERYPCPRGRTAACSNVELPAAGEEVLQSRLSRIQQSGGPFTIGLIGSLNGRSKGIDIALRAIAKAQPQLPGTISFRVLGDGDAGRWQQLADKLGIGKLVSFDGVLPSGGAVHEWLDGIDLYIQPSFQEGLPRATIEAMSRGCPTLGSTAGGIPELLDQECLHRPGHIAALAEQLVRAASSAEWRSEQAERNFSLAGAYTKERLDVKRHVFWRSFGHYVRSGGTLSELRPEGANA
ncbi:hypothetical protein PCCS19_29500 [Paenibacillus sp. CCS19]|uniref:glycosyltransferase n=1 Tax=Paenibacillus sp. CCS19 TaxID=3158387 RepID=UPI002564F70E|nr:glycosyltransferase family 4 protein [Paenibacillus cellulosilyticus]GMK39895.1 hypothetical protein PCCS19_29500 [Paenibacillus cellulosilyticus]